MSIHTSMKTKIARRYGFVHMYVYTNIYIYIACMSVYIYTFIHTCLHMHVYIYADVVMLPCRILLVASGILVLTVVASSTSYILAVMLSSFKFFPGIPIVLFFKISLYIVSSVWFSSSWREQYTVHGFLRRRRPRHGREMSCSHSGGSSIDREWHSSSVCNYRDIENV